MKLPTTDAPSGARKSEMVWRSRKKISRGIACYVAEVNKGDSRASSDCLKTETVGTSPNATLMKSTLDSELQTISYLETTFASDDQGQNVKALEPEGLGHLQSMPIAHTPPPSAPEARPSPSRIFSLFGLPIPNSPPPLKRLKRRPKLDSFEDRHARTGAARSLNPDFEIEARRAGLRQRRRLHFDDAVSSSHSAQSDNDQSVLEGSTNATVDQAISISRPPREVSFDDGPSIADPWDIPSQGVRRLGGEGQSVFTRPVASSPASFQGEQISEKALVPSLLRTPDASTRLWAAAAVSSSLELSQSRARKSANRTDAISLPPIRKPRLEEHGNKSSCSARLKFMR